METSHRSKSETPSENFHIISSSEIETLATLTSENRIGVRITDPQYPVHIRMPDGTEYTDADIRQWAVTGYPGDDERLLVGYLAHAIVCYLDGRFKFEKVPN